MTTLCHIDDITEGKSKGFETDRYHVFVVKKDDELFVYHNSCPHLGINLEWQEDQFLDPDGSLIQCSTHGAIFEINSGLCISGPCIHESLAPVPFEITADGNVVLQLS
jgi:nitrite reductase/ring-hydroxylating ferredoxin subunit